MDTASESGRSDLRRPSRARAGAAALVLVAATMSVCGCASSPILHLMETPAAFHEQAIDPFAHLQDHERTTELSVFYATHRAPSRDRDGRGGGYTNDVDDRLHLGRARVRFGSEGYTWERLHADSVSPARERLVPVVLESVEELHALPYAGASTSPVGPAEQAFIDAIDDELDHAIDPDVVVYVHGTKVDFANAAVMTAEVDHFAGRDFVAVAFAWPSHQWIWDYLSGEDVRRAQAASEPLRELLKLLGRTRARHIHVLAYSAGARVLSKALFELEVEERRRARLGAVVFAGADVPLRTFLVRMPAISASAEQVAVMVSDDDDALIAAKRFMGGDLRAGMADAEAAEEEVAHILHLDNFHVVDLSLHQEARGFDIVGHHYWYRHPWASSDVVMLLRTGLAPEERGLTPSEQAGVYYMSDEYPRGVREAIRAALAGSWFGRD